MSLTLVLHFRNTATSTPCWTDKSTWNDDGAFFYFSLITQHLDLHLLWYCTLTSYFENHETTHFHQLSKPIKAEEAHELGLVDAVVSPNDLLNVAHRWALDICESKRPWVRALYKSDNLGSPEEARQILNFARAQAREQAANLHHPLVCIDVIEEGIVSGPRAGLRKVCDIRHLPCAMAFGFTRKVRQI
jgi:hypothetical protein